MLCLNPDSLGGGNIHKKRLSIKAFWVVGWEAAAVRDGTVSNYPFLSKSEGETWQPLQSLPEAQRCANVPAWMP